MHLCPRSAALALLVVLPACGSGGASGDAVVPSPRFSTLQAAIDGLPSGSVVRLLPGTIRETVVLDGKRLTLLGSEDPAAPSQITAPSPNDPAVVILRNGAVLEAHDLTISGGQAGILAPRPPPQAVGDFAPCSLVGTALSLVASGRGVAGAFDRVVLTDGEVGLHAGTGISLADVILLRIERTRIHGNRGVGLYLDNHGGLDATDVPIIGTFHLVVDAVIEDNERGGIDVWGDAVPVAIVTSTLARNGLYGIQFDGANGSLVSACRVEGSKKSPGGIHGDGILVHSSIGLRILGTSLVSNERVGIAVYGCKTPVATGPSEVFASGLRLSLNAVSLANSDSDACLSPGGGWFRDLGGNVCDGGTCSVTSETLAPIDEPVHTP